jgi:hypothetical protein
MTIHTKIDSPCRLFFGKGPPESENRAKFFSHPDMTIHTPIAFSRNILLLNCFK